MLTAEGRILQVVSFADMDRWSAGDSILRNMKPAFPLTPLFSVLKRAKEPITVEDAKRYRRITVRLYGQGVLQRDERYGNEIGTKKQFVAHAGQIIISRIDARNGALGLVPEELEGAIVTNDFWLFDVKKAIPQYLTLVLSSDLFRQYWQTQSSGTTNRQRVDEAGFLMSKIALPPIEIQRKLIETYNATIQLAVNTEQEVEQAKQDVEAYLFAELGIEKRMQPLEGSILKSVSFKDIMQWGYDKNALQFPYSFHKFKAYSFHSRPSWVHEFYRGKSPQYSSTGTAIILNQKCNRKDRITLEYAKTVKDTWIETIDPSILTRKQDILINSTGEGTLGRASLVSLQEHVGLAYDSHMLLLRVNQEEVDPQLFVFLFNSSFGQKQVAMYKSAQATKQTELGIENTKKIVFPLPDIQQQRTLSSVIKKEMQRIDKLAEKAGSLRQRAKEEFEGAVFQKA